MDTVTHALFGALASQTVSRSSTPADNAIGHHVPLVVTTVAAAFPDIDYVLFPVDPLTFLAEWHRSYTNSIVLLPIWAILLTGIIVLLFPRLRKHAFLIGGFVVLGIASHILLDLLTVYGSRIFFPLSDKVFSLGTTFVIDPWLSLIIFTGLLLSFFRSPQSVAITCISLLCVYVLFQWHLKTQAREYYENGISESIALPQPFSPFHFRIIKKDNNHYKTTLIDLAGLSEKLQYLEGTLPYIEQVSAFKKRENARWETLSLFGNQSEQTSLIRFAWRHDAMTLYRDFARYPVLYRIDDIDEELCVWFSDLRYHIGMMTPSFRYGMCQNNKNKQWKRYRLKYFSEVRD